MNKSSRLNRTLTAMICLVFLWPLVLALVNHHFVNVFSGNILCALYYACLVMTYICYGGFQIKLSRDIGFMLFFLMVYGTVSFLSGEYVLLYNFVFALPIYLFCAKYLEIEDDICNKLFVWITSISVLITMALTIWTLVRYPGAARVLASNSFANYGRDLYRKMGCGGFDFIYSLVILVPVGLAACVKLKRFYKIIVAIATAGCIITILLSGYTTAILLLFLACTLFLCTINRGTLILTIVLSPLLIWLFINFRDEIANQVYAIAEMFSSKAVKDHLIELADIIAQKADVEDLDRVDLYTKSVEAFLMNPIFGSYSVNGASAVSGHSTILDLLGGGGLVCFMPYIGFLATWHTRIARMLRDRWTKIGWNISSIIYLALQLVNPIFANYLIIFVYMSFAVAILKACDLEPAT